MVLVAGFSSGFPMLRTTSICQGTNPCEQKWQIWPSTSMGTMVFCWSCKQKWAWEKNKQPTAFSVLIRFWRTNQNQFSPKNGQENGSSLYGTTRLGQLYALGLFQLIMTEDRATGMMLAASNEQDMLLTATILGDQLVNSTGKELVGFLYLHLGQFYYWQDWVHARYFWRRNCFV